MLLLIITTIMFAQIVCHYVVCRIICTWVVQPALRWDVCAYQTSGVDTDTSKSNTRRGPTDRPMDLPHRTDRTNHNVDARQQTKKVKVKAANEISRMTADSDERCSFVTCRCL